MGRCRVLRILRLPASGRRTRGRLRPTLRPDGRAQRAQKNLQLAGDVGALILAERIEDRAPLPLRGLNELDSMPGLVGTPVVGVGSGLNWAKRPGTPPTKGLGPMTDLGGGSGIKRVARLGSDHEPVREFAAAAPERAAGRQYRLLR